jgi:dihydrodipicolinate reductase
MSKIALVGAGGKMGCRLTDNFLKCPQYLLDYLEISERGIQNLKERNVIISRRKMPYRRPM